MLQEPQYRSEKVCGRRRGGVEQEATIYWFLRYAGVFLPLS